MVNWNGIELPESFYQDNNTCFIHGDCREVLSSIRGVGSAIVTDPPYELGFMGKSWDSKGVSFQKETWDVIRKSCKSGSMLLSFGGSRTQHRIACAIEDAGWELRDVLMWVYGSGFPKSMDISKAIDKSRKQVGEVIGVNKNGAGNKPNGNSFDDDNYVWKKEYEITAPASPESTLWSGWGTALKPAYEPIILAMNPLDKTFANNALKYGVAGLNIDGCRVGANGGGTHCSNRNAEGRCLGHPDRSGTAFGLTYHAEEMTKDQGRFPANFLHDGSEEVVEMFPNSKDGVAVGQNASSGNVYGNGKGLISQGKGVVKHGYGGSGSAARFFYSAKASRSERGVANNHPTVKPLALMEYLCKLVKMPEYNLIIDPFMGSGTTLIACSKLGIPCIGIDSDEQSCELATIRYLRSLANGEL